MPKATPLINNFNGGEISPRIDARSDVNKYYSGCRTLENMIPLVEGGAMRAPGTYFCASTKTPSKKTLLVSFHFSTIQAYVLEFGDQYIRFYMDGGQIVSGGNPYEKATPYLEADLFELKFTQSADILFIFHPNYAPKKLSRTGHTSWTLTDFVTKIQGAMVITGASKANPCVLTVSRPVPTEDDIDPMTITGATQANPCVLTIAVPATVDFPVGGEKVYIQDVGGMTELNNNFYTVANPNRSAGTIELQGVDSSGYGAYTSGGKCFLSTFDFPEADEIVYVSGIVGMTELNDRYFKIGSPNESAGTFELLGENSTGYTTYVSGGTAQKSKFGTAGNCPACGAFHEQRMMLGGSENNPQTVVGSASADWEDFTPDPDDDSAAIELTLYSERVDRIRWMVSQSALMIGTVGGIWRLSSANGTDPLSQTNVDAKKQIMIGAADIMPVVVSDSVLWLSRAGTSLRQLLYSYDVDRFIAPDFNRLSKHITRGPSAGESGIAQMAFQQDPIPILWAIRRDGQLLGMTYEIQEQVYAWFRIVTDGEFESAAVISQDNEEDQLWVIVKRIINGETKRYVEYFVAQEFYSELRDCFSLHSGLTFDGGDALSITAFTWVGAWREGVTRVTAPGHSFENGDKVRITGVEVGINCGLSRAYTVSESNPGAGTFVLSAVDQSFFPWSYIGGGSVQMVTKSLSGLSHLEGKSIDILIDGAVHPARTVVSGAVSLAWYGNKIHAGLGYESIVEPMKLHAGSVLGTARGKKQKINRLTVAFYETLGAKAGTDRDNLKVIPFGTGRAPELFTGDQDFEFPGDWGNEAKISIVQAQPLPMTLLAIVPRVSINED